ncbi:TetR/AcrR family transcriptional regulator [Cohnella terricola]|uniref:TetR/AcrR family transcriptional regulator n=1 Tax=Cohnella terricola TaxID=1289167 RepID=A0A559JJ58_9BACL|nr:TetR/AcrR family transcriptional regulator [Cohnella terricola]TVX99908.1 TetR/AcrR family transcriptional regulator [Cohnella terricola]
MPEKMDRRQARTKHLLHQALMELIEEKGIERITVTDIANRADVNRGTFYLHYRDVPDMLDKIMNEVFERLLGYTSRMDPRELSQYAYRDEPYPKLLDILEEIARNKDFFQTILGPNGDLSYAIRFRNMMASHIFNKFEYILPENGQMLVPRKYLVAYMASANFGMLMHWVESGMQESPYEMAMIATQLVNHGPIVSSGIREKSKNEV